MAKSLYEYRQDEQKRRENALRNYMTESASSVNKEGAKASSGFNLGDYFADFNQYTRAGGLIGGLAGLTKPLWYDKLSDEGRQRLDNYVDGSTFLSRKLSEGAMKSIEGVVDFGLQATPLYMIAAAANDDVRDSIKGFVERDFVGEWYDRDAYKHRENALLKDDGNAAQLAEGVGGMLPSVVVALATGGGSLAAQGASKLPQVLSLLTTATGAAGNATESAYKDGADYYSGLAYGAAIGGLEAATEKLVGGAFKGIQGAGLLDDIIPVGNWAKTGIGRYAANAVGEGVEEMTSEALAPHAKVIYKGKDAYADYDLGDHIKDIGKAGLMGAAISGIYGGAFDAIGGGVKSADVGSLLEDAEAVRTKGINLQTRDKLDTKTRERLKSQTLGDFKAIEQILRNAPEGKRADIIKRYQLEGMFEADGSINANFAKTLDGSSDLGYNDKYISYTARGSEQQISDTLANMSEDVAKKYAESNGVDIETARAKTGEFKVFNGELTENGGKAFTKFKKALSYLNKLSGSDVKFVVVEENSSFNGAIKDGVIYVGADTFESDKWAGTLVHEYMHYEEGSVEYNALVEHLVSDDALFASALSEVSDKGYGFDGAKLESIAKKVNAGEAISAEERRYYSSFNSEVSAHMGELLMGSEAFIDAIVAKDGNLAQKAVAKIKSLKAMFERLGNAEASAEYKFLKKAEDLYLKAAEKAGDARLVRYITSGEWDEEEAQYARRRRDPLINNVFPTYDPFHKHGSEANRLAIDWVHRKDTKTGDQALISYHDRWYLIQKFDDADLGYLIQRRVLVGEYKKVFEEINEYEKNSKIISLQRGSALYDKRTKTSSSLERGTASSDSAEAKHGREDRSVVRVAQNEDNWGERNRRDGDGDSSSGGADRSGDTVNFSLKDSEGKTLTPAQIEYFKNSKIRDENGNLLVVYHGTSEAFDIFDFSKIGQNGKAEGYGFYFSDDPEITKRYGEIQKSVYLNITKPLSKTKRTMTRAQFAKLVGAVIDLEMSQYSDEISDWRDTFVSNYVMTYDTGMTKQRAAQEFVNEVWDGCDNDVDLVYEIANGSGQSYSTKTMREFYDVLTKTLGYDGIVAEWTHNDGTSNVYVTFSSEQSKYVSNQTPTVNTDMRYSFKKGEEHDNNENKQADNKKPTSYTKAEASEMVSGILTEFFSAPEYAGKIKNMSDAVKMAMSTLNGAEAGKRLGPAQKLADYIIAHTVLTDTVDEWRLEPFARRLEQLKPYLHRLNLESIKEDIMHHYDKDRSPFARWAVKKGERGLGVDVMAQELEADGFPLFATYPADVFIEIDREYLAAREAFKKNADMAVKEAYSEEELKDLRQKITQEIMRHYDDRDVSFSSMMNTVKSATAEAERLRAANAKLRKEAWRQSKVAERAIAEKNEAKEKAEKERERRIFSEEYNRHASTVVGLVERIGEWKKGVFESAADANGDVFKGIIGSLTSIKRGKQLLPIKTREAMKKLADWYGAADIYPIVKDLKEGKVKLWDEAAFSAMVEVGDAKAIEEQRPLTVADVKNVELVIRHLKHITEVYHKAFKNGDYVAADELATNYLRIFRENANVNVGRVKKLIDSKYYEYFGDAEALMKWHDRYAEGGFFTETFNELREGALKMAIAQMEMRAELDAWLDKNHNFLKNITNKTIEVEGVEMTRAEALSLYMTARREHAEGGLAVGGFEVRGGKDGRKNSVDGLVEKEYLEAGKYDLEKLQGVLGKFQRDLYSKFTESEKTYLGFVEKILNEDCKLRKERTDNIRLGYSNTIEEFYYPIRRANVAKEVGKTDDTLGAELGRIRKLSFNQNTVIGSKGKLLIEPINNVVDRHIAGIAMYENISIAIDNFNLVFNYDISGNKNNPESIAKFVESNKDRDGSAIENSWANGGEYIDKLIKDIEGINTADKYEAKALAFIRSGFAKFQLGANPKTWVTQLSSLFAASSMLDPKYMAQAMVSKTSDKAFGAELDKYSPLAKLRNSENTSALAEGVMDKISGFGDVLMKPIGMTDRFVIKKLWYACQLQVEAEQKLELGSNDNKVAAAKLLEKVIFETQQNSLLTERSAAMRSNSELIKGLTMFSSDAMKVTARIVDAYGRVCVISDKLKRAEGDAKKALETERADAIKEFKRATGAAVSTAIFMSLVALAFSHLYGKRDDDETLGEKAKTFGADFAGNLIGGLPLVRDIYSLITDGYELNHYALSAVSDLVTGINGLFTLSGSLLSGKDVSLQDITSKTKAALFGVGQIFGIPLRNMYNVGRGVFGLGGWLTGNGKSFGYTWDSVFYDKSYQSDLNKAIAAGDDKLAARIASLMVGESFDGVDKAVSKEIRTLAEGGHIALPRAVGDSITYDGEEYRFTLRQRNRFERIYGTADEVLADLVKLKQYRDADDEVKAKAIKYVYDVYYNLAIDDMLGVDSSEKNVLFAEAIDIEKLAIIVAQARMFTADTGKDGTAISGSKKRKVINYIESLSLTAAQKYMIFGYLGYSNTGGEEKVKAYINRLKLTGAEKKTLLKYSGYAA